MSLRNTTLPTILKCNINVSDGLEVVGKAFTMVPSIFLYVAPFFHFPNVLWLRFILWFIGSSQKTLGIKILEIHFWKWSQSKEWEVTVDLLPLLFVKLI